jgi:poly-gamma-glutamate synthesis protein (capsule biosynthesis protein)
VGLKKKLDFISIKENTVAFLAYSFIEDHIVDTCYNKVQSENAIIEDIQNVKPISDLIIVSLHWGCEYVPYPSPDQIQIGRTLVDNGADIILGGHPHINQSFEIYKDRPIIYSLGNFIFDLTFIPSTNESFIAEIDIDESSNSINVNIIPILINKQTYRPQLLDNSKKNTFLKNIRLIRNLFENRSISDYLESIGDYNVLHNNKKQAAKWNMKVHFAKNFYRYSFPTIYSIIKEYVDKQKQGQL